MFDKRHSLKFVGAIILSKSVYQPSDFCFEGFHLVQAVARPMNC